MNKGIITVLIVYTTWALEAIGIEYLMKTMEPVVYTLLKLGVAAVILIPILIVKEKGLHVEKKDWLRMALSGILGTALYFNCENIGTAMTSAAFATMVLAIMPVMGIFWDRIFFKEKITKVKIICVFGSIVGVSILVAGQPMGASAFGFIVMLIGALVWSLSIVCVKPLEEKYSLTTVLAGMVFPALIFQLIITLIARPEWTGFTPKNMVVVVLLGMFGVVFAEYLYVYSIGRLSVTLVTIFQNIFPIMTIVLSLFIFGSTLTVIQMAGAAVILASVTFLALKEE